MQRCRDVQTLGTEPPPEPYNTIIQQLPSSEPEGYHMLLPRHMKPAGHSVIVPDSQKCSLSYTCRIYSLPYTWARRCPRLTSVAVIDRLERMPPPLPPQERKPILLSLAGISNLWMIKCHPAAIFSSLLKTMQMPLWSNEHWSKLCTSWGQHFFFMGKVNEFNMK